jgi:hypothetical protein
LVAVAVALVGAIAVLVPVVVGVEVPGRGTGGVLVGVESGAFMSQVER